jgi:hypothetical protein
MNDDSQHLSLEELIQVSDGASPDEGHSADCPTCQAQLRAWNRISEAVSVAVGAAEPPPKLIDDVLASIACTPAPRSARRRIASSRRARLGSVAALVIVGLGAFGLTFAFGPSTGVSGVAGASASVLGRSVLLPGGFRLVTMSDSSCDPWVVTLDVRVPVDTTKTQLSAAHGQIWTQTIGDLVKGPRDRQGCIQASKGAPYTLPAGVSATTPFVPSNLGGSPTSIDGFYAEVVPIAVWKATAPTTGMNWIQVACGSRPPGASGPSGASGASGPSGNLGAVGASGASGASGPSGNSGAVGASGASGASGSSGNSGSHTVTLVPCRTPAASAAPAPNRALDTVIPGTVIYVRVPATNGKYQLVTVIGWSMSAKQLVAITTEALAPKS